MNRTNNFDKSLNNTL